MDLASIQQTHPLLCGKHQQNKIEFIKIKETIDSPSNKLLYCSTCMDSEDSQSKEDNYLQISQIIKDDQKNIIPKWPPVNESQVLANLIKLTEDSDYVIDVTQQISLHFAKLKEDLLQKIEDSQQKMINKVQELLAKRKKLILEKYQQISQISKLRSILIEEASNNLDAVEQRYHQFITQIVAEKQNNSELLNKLFEESRNKELLINFDHLSLIKKQIIEMIDSFDFYNSALKDEKLIVRENDFNNQDNNNEISLKQDSISKKINAQPIDMRLIKAQFQDGINRTVISEDRRSMSIDPEQNKGRYYNGHYINCLSNSVLEKEKKYIFRFQISTVRLDEYSFMFGLMENSNCDLTQGFNSKLSVYLKHKNSQIQYEGGYGIDNHLKGDKLKLGNNKEMEMRVWLGGQQLEVLDYPDYNYRVSLADAYKSKLIELNDLKYYIGLGYDLITITQTAALQVDNFPI